MQTARSEAKTSDYRLLRLILVLILSGLILSGCSSININAAKELSAAGRSSALQMQQNIMVSEKEYQRSADSEAFMHGYTNTTGSAEYEQLMKLESDVYAELSKRAVIFDRLADLYDAFGELAGLDSGKQTGEALKNLGAAIEGYAKLFNMTAPVSDKNVDAISKIGALAATEIQKAKIREAGIQIRDKLEAILGLLGNSRVRNEIVGYRKVLNTNRIAAFNILLDTGIYEMKPLVDDFGIDAGLAAQKDVSKIIKQDPKLAAALKEVIKIRLAKSQIIIEKSYDASLNALTHLIVEHKKLEKEEPLDLNRVRSITSELKGLAGLLTNTQAKK